MDLAPGLTGAEGTVGREGDSRETLFVDEIPSKSKMGAPSSGWAECGTRWTRGAAGYAITLRGRRRRRRRELGIRALQSLSLFLSLPSPLDRNLVEDGADIRLRRRRRRGGRVRTRERESSTFSAIWHWRLVQRRLCHLPSPGPGRCCSGEILMVPMGGGSSN